MWEMIYQGAAVFPQIHAKAVQRTRLGCHPQKKKTTPAGFSAHVLFTVEYTAQLNKRRQRSLIVSSGTSTDRIPQNNLDLEYPFLKN